MTKFMTLGMAAIAGVMAIAMSVAQSQQQRPAYSYPPLSSPRYQYYQQHPEEFQQMLKRMPPVLHEAPAAAAPQNFPTSGTWSSLNYNPGVNLMNPLLMTDGTVIATVSCAGTWYKLTPDINGSYINGTWSQIASMPSGYAPRFFGSAVLPDGRVIAEGGEYNGNGCGGRTTLGAIYNPATNSWTSVSPPSGWGTISDAAGIVLPSGTYMQTSCCDNPPHAALLNASALTWTATGTGKFDPYDEEALALQQSDLVLTVDAYTQTGTCGKNTETYNPSTGAWTSAGNVPVQQADCNSTFPSYEVGPLVTRPDGTAVTFGGITTGTVGTDIRSGSTWSAGPNIPTVSSVQYTLADAPGAVLPNGNILFAASPGNWTSSEQFPTPTHFFELALSNNTITQVNDASWAASTNSFETNFLVLPTGQILATNMDGVNNIQIYTPQGTYQSSWRPVITSVPSCVNPGGTYVAYGNQLNGLTEGSYYGDDVSAPVNFPVIRIVNNSSGHVFYAKTFNHSTRSIAPGVAVTASFTVASGTETGASTLYDVGAGIPSAGTPITVSSSCATASLTRTHDFNGDGKSDIAWRGPTGDLAIWLMNGTQILSGPDLGNVPTNWSIVGQRQLNNSGYADLLWRGPTGDLSIWFMNGTQIVSTADFGTIPTSWSIVGTSAYNASKGYAELFWRDTAGDLSIWQINGAQILSAPALGNVPTNWTIAGIGDFSGTGNADILWRGPTGDVAIWFMNGTQIVSSPDFINVPTSWTIVGTGDFNGDGKTDILWRNSNRRRIDLADERHADSLRSGSRQCTHQLDHRRDRRLQWRRL